MHKGVNMLRMKADEIDDDGCWNNDGTRWQLLGSLLPIPPDASVSGTMEHEEVLAVVQNVEKICPVCPADELHRWTVLVTQHYRMVPSRCCSKIIWFFESSELTSYA